MNNYSINSDDDGDIIIAGDVISEIAYDLTEKTPVQISMGSITEGLTAPERTASINRWLVSLQGRTPEAALAIDADGYYAEDSAGYYALGFGG